MMLIRTWRNSGGKSLTSGRKYQGSTSLHTRCRHSQTLAVIMIRQVRRKSNFRQVVTEQTYGQLHLCIQRRTNEIEIPNTENLQHSCLTLCYRPAEFFCNLRLTMRSFSQGITRRALKKWDYFFYVSKTACMNLHEMKLPRPWSACVWWTRWHCSEFIEEHMEPPMSNGLILLFHFPLARCKISLLQARWT